MSIQVGSACYETPLAAFQAIASGFSPTIQGALEVTVANVSPEGVELRYLNLETGVVSLKPLYLVLQPCNMLTASDALNVGWMIGGAWLSVYAITFLIRYLRGEMDSIDARDA